MAIPTLSPADLHVLKSLGPITVEATDRGVSKVELGARGEFALGDSPEAVTIAGRALDQIYEYVVGKRRAFDVPIDLGEATPFRRKVLEALLEIPFGSTTTYGEVARAIGSSAPRAVGQAVGGNPVPIIVPCHRVLAADGRLGGYSGGLARKSRLLSIEGMEVDGTEFQSRVAAAAS